MRDLTSADFVRISDSGWRFSLLKPWLSLSISTHSTGLLSTDDQLVDPRLERGGARDRPRDHLLDLPKEAFELVEAFHAASVLISYGSTTRSRPILASDATPRRRRLL